jgi:hypothetical protein
MKVIDPGHSYALRVLDEFSAKGEVVSSLVFVKREGPGYPGNVGHHSGTTTQEVLRALIDRAHYVNGQIPDERNDDAIAHMRDAIYALEHRAAERHDRLASFEELTADYEAIEKLPTCAKCNHIGCDGSCH